MKYNINFFTCCNNLYSEFAGIFALSSLYYNDDAVIEIGFDSDKSIDKIKPQIEYINSIYPNKFVCRTVNFTIRNKSGQKYSSCPNVIRFLEQPTIQTEYVYISDIDIICLEKNIVNIHVSNMAKHNLPFSNMVRESKPNAKYKRLTGLHFTKWENYYPIKNYDELAQSGILVHDEVFLYKLIEKRGLKIDDTVKFRPVHGIHVSPNRPPANWGINKFKNEWSKFRQTKEFLNLESLSSDKIKHIYNQIDLYENTAPNIK